MEIDLLCGVVWGAENDNRIKHYFFRLLILILCFIIKSPSIFIWAKKICNHSYEWIEKLEMRSCIDPHQSHYTRWRWTILNDDFFCVTNQFINIRKWHPRGSWLSTWHFKELKNIKSSTESSTSVVVRDSFLLLSRMMMLQEFKREAEHERREENNS